MYNYLARTCDVVLVEGIGGVMVPLDEQTTIIDLAAKMKLPTVVVARVKLGTINHTLLTVQAIRNAGLYMAGVVINGYSVPPPISLKKRRRVLSLSLAIRKSSPLSVMTTSPVSKICVWDR